jgi:phage N-6-adenine-methyltransferase
MSKTDGSCGLIAKLQSGTLIPMREAVIAMRNETDPVRLTDLAKALDAAKKIDNKNREQSHYWGMLAIHCGKILGMRIQEGQKAGLIDNGRGGDRKSRSHAGTVIQITDIVPTKNYASRCYKLAALDDDTIEAYGAAVQEHYEDPTKAGVIRYAADPCLVGKMTGCEDNYTPLEYIEAARQVMGSIDLDPASCELAQETVQAGVYYTAADDGLNQDWVGNVWLNPPYTARVINGFVSKLCGCVTDGCVPQAVLLTNNNTDTSWFHEALESAAYVCFTRGRIGFNTPDGKVTCPTNGQSFFYFGKRAKAFSKVFSQFGAILNVVA